MSVDREVRWLIGMSNDVWEGVTVVRKCDSPKEICQSMGRCDGHQEK